jgi:hypothetical protein
MIRSDIFLRRQQLDTWHTGLPSDSNFDQAQSCREMSLQRIRIALDETREGDDFPCADTTGNPQPE